MATSSSSVDTIASQKKKEAEKYLAKARVLREGLPPDQQINAKQEEAVSTTTSSSSPWNVVSDVDGVDYRLQVDIGREEGSWMDPRWGASGRRIEFSLDVRFATTVVEKNREAAASRRRMMVQDNLGGQSSEVFLLETATNARLRNGFDRMKCDWRSLPH